MKYKADVIWFGYSMTKGIMSCLTLMVYYQTINGSSWWNAENHVIRFDYILNIQPFVNSAAAGSWH